VIRIGTSGYSYDDWIGPFYPPGLSKGAFLRFYSQRFCTVEVNMTYYRLPAPSQVASWCRRTPSSFDFVIKAHRSLTHERAADAPGGAARDLLASIGPLVEEGRLGAVLAQFPNSFRPDDAAREYLQRLPAALAGTHVICEFRHAEWATDETLALLTSLGMGYCCVDEPRLRGLMPPLAVRTSPIGYVRFHGRNASKWYSHEEAYERYDYGYSTAELTEWVGGVKEITEGAEGTYVFFNNHYQAKAPANAMMFADLLLEAGLGIAAPQQQTGRPPLRAKRHDALTGELRLGDD